MKKHSMGADGLLIAIGILALQTAGAQATEPEPPRSQAFPPAMEVSTVPLWNGPAPGALGNSDEDVPTLTIFMPTQGRGNGTAVIVAPGGGYQWLSMNHEGRQVADWFATRGITAFVLKYRLAKKYIYPVPLLDAQRAIRLVRSLKNQYNLAPDRVGIAGFSAGGHLAAMTGTSFDNGKPDATDPVDRLGCRPDFLVLGYAWMNAMEPTGSNRLGSYESLMGVPREKQAFFEESYSPTRLVTAQTPPAFIFSTTDDQLVPVEASIGFYSALRKAGVPAEMHIFRRGGHGAGLGAGDPALELWPLLLSEWLRGQGFLSPEAGVSPGPGRNPQKNANPPPR